MERANGIIFYNTELLKRAGVGGLTTKFGDPAWTWDAFVQLTRKLTSGGGANALYGYNQSTWWVYMQPFVWSNGGDYLNKDRTGGAIDQPEAVEALQRMQDLALKDKAMPVAANAPEGSPGFENGRVAMTHTNAGGWLPYSKVPDLKFDIAPVPTGKKGTFARNPPNGWASWSGNKERDNTWLVMIPGATHQRWTSTRSVSTVSEGIRGPRPPRARPRRSVACTMR